MPQSIPMGRRPVHFLHIGKNAGTYITLLSQQINEAANEVHIVKQGHAVTLGQIPVGEEYFFSIRDPISRFYSGFYSRKRRGRPRYDNAWSDHDERAFADFDHANDLAESLFEPGDSGGRALCAIKSLRHTAQDQISWFELCGNFLQIRPPIWIVRRENLKQDFKKLADRLAPGLTIDFTADSVASHEGVYSDLPPLSDKAKVNLRRWYAQDFEFYRVCEIWIETRMGLPK